VNESPTTTDAIAHELRLWRAALLCAVLVLQLLFPAAVLRAEALARELCSTTGSASNNAASHRIHMQQCAHCTLCGCEAVPEPAVRDVVPAIAPRTLRIVAATTLPTPPIRAAAPRGPPL
jgi:hypothetical protein